MYERSIHASFNKEVFTIVVVGVINMWLPTLERPNFPTAQKAASGDSSPHLARSGEKKITT
jgi:hypothetical protein